MSTKEIRGTKRSCQNPECGSRFYDLNRAPMRCPLCGAAYVIASAPGGLSVAQKQAVRKVRVPEFANGELAAPDQDPAVEETEALAESTETPDEPVVAEVDETVLEEDEDGGDVSGILDAPVAPGEQDV